MYKKKQDTANVCVCVNTHTEEKSKAFQILDAGEVLHVLALAIERARLASRIFEASS